MSPPNLLLFFTDSVLRGPTLGCMLMCLAASLIGTVVFLRKQSLLGEVLSHAAYPGIILGIICAGFFSIEENDEWSLSILVLTGAFLTAMLGTWTIQALVKHAKVPADAALCFVLSSFFAIGLTLASEVQFTLTSLYKQALTYFYGQAATMTDRHIAIYGVFACLVVLFVCLFYKELQVMTFDRSYAKSLGLPVRLIEGLIFFLVTAAVIIGIRSMGVILMSAMLIAPVVAARQLTHRLSYLFAFSALFGILSGFLGIYFSVYLTHLLSSAYPSARIILPTGPMIVLTAAAMCCLAIVFAPKGVITRLWQIRRFRNQCLSEYTLTSKMRGGH